MYLSRVEIDINNRKKVKDLSHLGAIHGFVEQCFPLEIQNNIRSRKLWRIDTLNNKKYLLIVSRNMPDTDLLEKYGVKNTAITKNYEPFLKSLKNNMIADFRVTLNPVFSKPDYNSTSKRGQVIPYLNIEDKAKFLINQSEKNGFFVDVDNFKIVESGFVPLKHKKEKTVRLSKVTYEGKLKIIDIDKFIQTLTLGFGKKKAYGFGMMTVIPVRL